jgi:uncharacterized protein YbjT (DUF2867 family)
VIAVVGATGWVGSALVGELAAGSEAVRALTRRPERWSGPEIEVVAADADGRDGLAGAFDGARAAFLMSDQAAEATVTGSGVTWTLLRPGRFFANAAHWARSVRAGESVPVGFAHRVAAGIDPADVAAVAAAALVDPASSAGTAPRLTGPEPLTPLDELAILGEVLGRPLRARELTPEEVRRGTVASGQVPEVVDAVVARSVEGKEGAEPSPDVAGLLGRPARRFQDWAREHAGLFG